MADKSTDAPLGATHYGLGWGCDTYYKLDGGKWSYWSYAYEEWRLCDGNKPALTVTPLEAK